MKKPLIIIDAGHGGIDPKTGEYVTPGKRYEWEDFTVFEGVVNREIAYYLRELLARAGYPTTKTAPSYEDVPLYKRVLDANEYLSDPLFVSIHNNAGGGAGMECFSFHGSTKSHKLNRAIYRGFEQEMPNYPRRGNGKTANFYVLRKTKMRAVLVECGFMDNRHDAELMSSKEGQKMYAEAIFKGIEIYHNGLDK